MSKPQDGFVSRFLNRPISRRITSVLLKFPIHPSAWTISIFVLPVIASVFLVRGNYISVVIAAAIFQVFSILDGCDGEIARAKNLESKFGERLDYFCDFTASLLYVLTLGQRVGPTSWQEQNVGCFVHVSRVVLRETPYHDRAFRLTESWRTIYMVAFSADQTRHGYLCFFRAWVIWSG
jgi:phosphatidylglycerophosphate synthase